MSTLSVKNLTKIYGTNTVLDSVDLDVPQGALVALLGPSGCGKTTTLRLIAGFEPANAGDIYIDGELINDIPAHKRNLGVVFQSYALFPHMTVYENVAYGLEQRGFSKQNIKAKVDEMLSVVKMSEYRDRKPKQLSGGQQQRVALARALVIEPKVVLLDECLSALDKKLRVEMQVELRRILAHFGATALFVTHDQEEALTLSDLIVVMEEGKIVQWGKPYDVYEKPKNKFVAGFLGRANFFEGTVETDDGQGKVMLNTEHGLAIIKTKKSPGPGKHAIYSVRPEKVVLKEVRENQRNVEGEIYGKITVVTYVGNLSTYRIDWNGKELIAESQNIGETSVFSVGNKVSISWEPEFCRLLED